MKSPLVVVAFLIATSSATTVTDDFNSYPDGSLAIPKWLPLDMGFRARSGSYEFTTFDVRSFSLLAAADVATDTSAEATIVVRSRNGKNTSWAVVGLAIFIDKNNFWACQLVESPGTYASPYSHFVELEEMSDGQWSSRGKHSKVVEWPSGWLWSYGEPIRVRLTMSPAVPHATLSAAFMFPNGTKITGMTVNITSPDAVLSGRLALSVGAFDVTFDDVSTTWTHPAPIVPDWPQYSPPSTCVGPSGLSATGFFHVQKVGKKFWLVDPLGLPFFSIGTDHMQWWGNWCETLGRFLYHENVTRIYNNNETAWALAEFNRLKSWGFTSLGTGTAASITHRGLPHMTWHSTVPFSQSIPGGYIAPVTTWTGFPNVFHPDWTSFLTVLFADVLTAKDDPVSFPFPMPIQSH